MKRHHGFTLAEVLITLGIIGVVAAMTIPTLIANTNSARFRSQFKKTISTLSQAGLMAQAQFDIDYSTPTAGCTGLTDDPDSLYTICAIFNGTLSGHTISNDPPASRANAGTYAPQGDHYTQPAEVAYLSLADGSLVIFSKSMTRCHKTVGGAYQGNNCIGYIDVNGTTLPNREVSCEAAAAGNGGMLAQPAYADDEQAQGDGDGGDAAAGVEGGTCVVPNDANHMTDIFPIVFHDGVVEPATAAARYVLTTSK